MPFSGGTYTRTKTFATSGTLTPADLNSIQDDLGGMLAGFPGFWKNHFWVTTSIFATGGTYILANDAQEILIGTANSSVGAIYIDPAEFQIGNMSTRLRIRQSIIVNSVAPAVDITITLNPVLTFSGASGSRVAIATVGPPIPGSTVFFTNLSATSKQFLNSSEFLPPAAGFYAFVETHTAPSANFRSNLHTWIQYRHV